MKLRKYKKEDAQIIINWIKDEEEFYRWSADRFNRYPITGKDLDEHYALYMKSNRFMPLVMTNDTDDLIGQFIIRYPKEDDDSRIRFGFVLIDPQHRGKGYGKKMLELGIEYAKEKLDASVIELGVFENNKNAINCYKSLGFKEFNRRQTVLPIGTWECIDMKLNI